MWTFARWASHTGEEFAIPLDIRLEPGTALLKGLVHVGFRDEALDEDATISLEEVDDVFDWGIGRNLLDLGAVLAGSHDFFFLGDLLAYESTRV